MINILENLRNAVEPAEKHVVDYKAGYHEALDDLQFEYDKLCPLPHKFTYQDYRGKSCDYNYIAFSPDGSIILFLKQPKIALYGWQNEKDSLI